MIRPRWLASKQLRNSVVVLEGLEQGSTLRDLLPNHTEERGVVFNASSLACGDDPRDVVKPVVEAHAKGFGGVVVVAPVWGTMNDAFDWFIVTDHINLSGENPLRGGPLVEGKPWFTPMGDAYARILDSVLEGELEGRDLAAYGVLAGLSGPTHPTAAEKKVLAAWGCEVYSWYIFTPAIAAAHLGMQFVAVGWNGDREIALRSLFHLSP